MKLDEENLDRMLTNDKLSPEMKMSLLEHHAEENIKGQNDLILAGVGIAIITGLVTYYCFFKDSEEKSQKNSEYNTAPVYSEKQEKSNIDY